MSSIPPAAARSLSVSVAAQLAADYISSTELSRWRRRAGSGGGTRCWLGVFHSDGAGNADGGAESR